jgi:hypothetical protein
MIKGFPTWTGCSAIGVGAYLLFLPPCGQAQQTITVSPYQKLPVEKTNPEMPQPRRSNYLIDPWFRMPNSLQQGTELPRSLHVDSELEPGQKL